LYDVERPPRYPALHLPLTLSWGRRVLLCLASLVVVSSGTVLASHPPRAGADTIAGAKAKAASITATLAAAQNKMSALGQQFDAARSQLGEVNSQITTTRAAIAQKKQQVHHDTVVLQKAAISSYVNDGTAAGANPLFSSDAKTQGAANEYTQIASGDLDEAVANLNTAKNKLTAQQVQLNVQQKQAQAAVASEQAAVTANQLVEQQQSSALAQENSEIATLVAQQQQEEATQAAAAARRQIEAAEAAQARAVAETTASSGPRSGSGSSSGSTHSYTPVPVAQGASGAIAAAESQLGVPYVWGGETPGVGFDCSGLVQWAWRQAGVNLPRTSGAQFAAVTPVSVADLEPGDLLFYGPNGDDHVAMYVGNGTMIEAPETGELVHLTPLRLGGYGESFAGAGRP
jgi:cell wall-associated NlpC family hydrolase